MHQHLSEAEDSSLELEHLLSDPVLERSSPLKRPICIGLGLLAVVILVYGLPSAQTRRTSEDSSGFLQAYSPTSTGKQVESNGHFLTEISLFCFMVVTPATPEQLVDAIRTAEASVFACEASAIYKLAGARSNEVESVKDVTGKIWRSVHEDGQYLEHDWTVKADVDTVFLPERLKMHLLMGLKPPVERPVYLRNSVASPKQVQFKSALEVLSKEAVDLLIKKQATCEQHDGSSGADLFLMSCLDAIEVGYMVDGSLLDDKQTSSATYNPFDVDRCMDEGVVAFTPYGSVNAWMGCHKVAKDEVTPFQFVSCKHRRDEEACSAMSPMAHLNGHEGTGIVA